MGQSAMSLIHHRLPRASALVRLDITKLMIFHKHKDE